MNNICFLCTTKKKLELELTYLAQCKHERRLLPPSRLHRAYIALPSVPAYQLSTSDFTVEAWVKTYSGGPVLGILATKSSPGFYLLLNGGSIDFNTQDRTSYTKGFVSGVSLCDGMWHHIAAVRNGANVLAYLDTTPIR